VFELPPIFHGNHFFLGTIMGTGYAENAIPTDHPLQHLPISR
jgi:hypothetical protein